MLYEVYEVCLIYCDVKLVNLFVCWYGIDCDFVKVLGFGLVVLQSGLDFRYILFMFDGMVLGVFVYVVFGVVVL